MTSADWEGNALAALGLRADLGPPLIAELVAGQAGRSARASRRAIASWRSTTQPVRSPGDVAAITNARPGFPPYSRVERGGATRDVTVTPEAQEQGGRTVGIAGLKLKSTPRSPTSSR